MINIHKNQEDIINNIYEIVCKSRNNNCKYEKNDYLYGLVIYTLFSKELTRWILFGAYAEKYENKFKNMIDEIIGEKSNLEEVDFKSAVQNYIKDKNISNKQIEILTILGLFAKEDNDYKKEEKKIKTDMVEVNKIGVIKRIFNKIKHLLRIEKNEEKNY